MHDLLETSYITCYIDIIAGDVGNSAQGICLREATAFGHSASLAKQYLIPVV